MFVPSDHIRKETATLLDIKEVALSEDWEIEVGNSELINELSGRNLINEISSKDLVGSHAEIMACAFLILLSSIDEALCAESHTIDKLTDILTSFVFILKSYKVLLSIDLSGNFLYWIDYFENPDRISNKYQTNSKAIAKILRKFSTYI